MYHLNALNVSFQLTRFCLEYISQCSLTALRMYSIIRTFIGNLDLLKSRQEREREREKGRVREEGEREREREV